MYKPRISFILPTYNRSIPLYTALMSLLNQTDNNWEAIVVQDGEDNSVSSSIVANLPPCPQKANVKHVYTKERYNDWGHTPRNIGKNIATGDWVIMSGDDNYYVPLFVETLSHTLQRASNQDVGMVYWDMIHSHYDYSLFRCAPAFNQIDMGAFATRTDLAKQIDLNKTFAADGDYVEEFKRRFPEKVILKINKVLYVHN